MERAHMTSKRPLFILLGLAVATGVVMFVVPRLRASEEARVAARLAELAETVSKTGDESVIVSATRARKAVGFFTPTFLAEPGDPFPRLESADEFTAALASIRGSLDRLRVKVAKREIAVDGDRADVHLVLEATYSGGFEGRGNERRTFDVGMKKHDGEWKIDEFVIVE